ncbi:MAG: transaldolase [Zoogloeaceae bacterium]|jgi:transaldolase|nr:transaldolase [Zoogloeaceae bacterium]
MSRLKEIARFGQQIWLDNLTRQLLERGTLAHWIAEDGIAGVTSNPAIFHNAIKSDPGYRNDLARIKRDIPQPEMRFEALVLPDIRRACDLLRPVHDTFRGQAGFVSFEVSPGLAHDAAGTIAAARRLWQAIDRPNAMIKIPATPAGMEAITEVIAAGINVNATLIFGPTQLAAVQAAHHKGLEKRAAQGESVREIASVASVFISRIDTLLDPRLPPELRGKVAIASARDAYARWRDLPPPPRGAMPQKLLWASTSGKNPAYRDVLYVEELIGSDTVNTVPDATLAAFRDHGVATASLVAHSGETQTILKDLRATGIDLDRVGETLLFAGLEQFEESFASLLELVN